MITLTCSEADPCDSGQRQHSAIPENLVPALISFRLGANGSRNLSLVPALIFSFFFSTVQMTSLKVCREVTGK